MSSIGTGYDLSVTTYSPDGRLFQVEYAAKAVENSGTAIGICCRDGVVLGVEKLVETKMMEHGSNERIFNVARHAGMAVTGWKPDTRQIVKKGRSEAKEYLSFYGSPIPGHVLCERLSNFLHSYTMYGYLRPFGATILLATHDEGRGYALWMIEPSGTSWSYHAAAVGKARQASKTEIEKLNFNTVTCREAVKEIARVIYTTHDFVKDKPFELELSWICEESKNQHERVPEEIRKEAEEYAKNIIKEKEEEEEEEEELMDVE